MTNEEREDLNTFKHDLVKQARWWQWKAETLEKENEQLKAENAALRERLEKAVEHGKYFIIEEPRNGKIYYSIRRHKVINNYICTELTRAEAEARLAELKGEKE